MNESFPCRVLGSQFTASPWGLSFLLKIGLLGLLLALVVLLGGWIRRDHPEVPVVIAGENLHLGVLWAGTAARRSVTLENLSDREVALSGVRTTCGCVDLVAESVVLNARESREVELVVDVPAPRMLSDDSESMPFSSLLRLEANGLEGRLPPIQVRGTIRTLLTPEMSVVRFEEPLIAGQPFPEQTVRITAAEPLTSLEPVAEDVPATLRIESVDAKTYALAIRVHDDLPPGPFRFELPLRAQLVGGETVDLKLLRVMDRIVPEVAAIPPEVQWGLVPPGRTARAEVVLRSMIGQPFEISSVVVEPPDETFQFEIRETNEGKVLVIEATVGNIPSMTGTIAVESVGAEGRAATTPIPVSYRGVVQR